MSNIKSNNILRIILVLCVFLIVAVWAMYKPFAWPFGKEAAFCLLSVVLISTLVVILCTKKIVKISERQEKNVVLGLSFGLLWTIEISMNNFIRPGLPLRDILDNIFWAVIALAILIAAVNESYHSDKFVDGLKSGL